MQALAVVAGVVISVLSFNATRQKEAHSRELEAHSREVEARRRQHEAARPFLELRQKAYLEAVRAAAVLANPENRSEEELASTRKRFRELYVAELSLVEDKAVERAMMKLAETVDPSLRELTPEQRAAYDLAHALRDSLLNSWNLQSTPISAVSDGASSAAPTPP